MLENSLQVSDILFMSSSTDTAEAEKPADSTELLQTLDRKKRALEEVIRVAQTVERLQQGLQAELRARALGEDADVAKELTRRLDGLLRGLLTEPDEAVENLPVARVLQLDG